jgi:mRNA interferase RelE/StbE
MFKVILSPEAQAFYAAADKPLARKLARCFAQLETEPRRNNNIKRLSGRLAGLLRYRVGDWRVIYRIDDASERVLVLSIANRREVYERGDN